MKTCQKDAIKNWPTNETILTISEQNEKKTEPENEDSEITEMEGEQFKRRGRRKKRQIESEGEKSNLTRKKLKKAETFIREPYETRSRKVATTSFAKFIDRKQQAKENEFLNLEEKFLQTKNKINDEILDCLHAEINNDPITFREVMESKNKNEWLKAIKEEIDFMDKNQVWLLVDRPKFGRNNKRPNIIDSKWVFKRKNDSSGTTRFKARLVIRGFKDTNSYDLKETYAQVSRLTLVRAVLAVINYYDLEARQLDVKTAFLNGTIEEEVYMEIPDGMEISEQIRHCQVCKIQRSMYGLRISHKR